VTAVTDIEQKDANAELVGFAHEHSNRRSVLSIEIELHR
jgi:hypothetical protein